LLKRYIQSTPESYPKLSVNFSLSFSAYPSRTLPDKKGADFYILVNEKSPPPFLSPLLSIRKDHLTLIFREIKIKDLLFNQKY